VHFAVGGMGAVVDGLVRLLADLGVALQLSSPVDVPARHSTRPTRHAASTSRQMPRGSL